MTQEQRELLIDLLQKFVASHEGTVQAWANALRVWVIEESLQEQEKAS